MSLSISHSLTQSQVQWLRNNLSLMKAVMSETVVWQLAGCVVDTLWSTTTAPTKSNDGDPEHAVKGSPQAVGHGDLMQVSSEVPDTKHSGMRFSNSGYSHVFE